MSVNTHSFNTYTRFRALTGDRKLPAHAGGWTFLALGSGCTFPNLATGFAAVTCSSASIWRRMRVFISSSTGCFSCDSQDDIIFTYIIPKFYNISLKLALLSAISSSNSYASFVLSNFSRAPGVRKAWTSLLKKYINTVEPLLSGHPPLSGHLF